MAQYKVIQTFSDIHTNELYKAGDVIEMTVKRANEAIKNLSKYNGEFLERIDDKDDDKGGDDTESGE